jgi:acyl carrier protein
MTRPDLAQRLADVLLRTLHLPQDTDCESLQFGREVKWDSIAHLQLLTELEQEFGVTIGNEDVLEMNNFRNILHVLRRIGV